MDHSLTVALIRHGKTPSNLRRSFTGSIDQALAPEGTAELRAFVRQKRYPTVERVLASSMRRCIETACIIYPDAADDLTGDPDTYTIPDLRERCFGEFEGKTHEEIITIPGYESWGMTEELMDFPGGETMESFSTRIAAAFWRQVSLAGDNGIHSLAIITHGGVMRGVLTQFAKPGMGYFDWDCPNGGGYLLGCEPKTRRITVRGTL